VIRRSPATSALVEARRRLVLGNLRVVGAIGKKEGNVLRVGGKVVEL
jgi:hypothetical protein